ncbi:hypothetical protein C8R43DRAFT_1090958 [Mycena crocata]|nr:hypothetical protein C8R43DRAFT_1090958 [Mycena crocata]
MGGRGHPHRRGRGGAPVLYEHRPDRTLVMRTSADNRRAHEESTPVIAPPVVPPPYYQEDVGTNAVLESPDWDYGLGDDTLPPDPVAPADGISDLPFLTWVEFRDAYLDEMLRGEGRGQANVYSACGSCGAINPAYRCENQTCYGSGMFCKACIVDRHQVLPTHWIQEWCGTHFKRISLGGPDGLGLVMQLGHTPGSACTAMRPARKKFTVIDVTGLHTITLQFCCCDDSIKPWQQLMRVGWWPATVRDPSTCTTFGVIRLFQNMNCLGKISGYHFLRALELLTNADGLHPPPVRCLTVYLTESPSCLHVHRAPASYAGDDEAGRARSCERGVGGTAQGELALACRACPQPGRNLPVGWDKIDWTKMPQDLSYKYFLFLAQDCNFRLINRNISTEARDPYKAFLRNHVEEEEISSCSGFQAMFLANAKRVKGLRTTGVGGVTCARHNMWRANGIGDLQHGERYCNIDFIMFSSILNAVFMFLILSYDIACQYSKNFWTRMTKLPAMMHIDPEKVRVWFKVPNFHMLGHKPPCHSPFSFHWMWGAEVTDGEDVEQNWEFTNGAAGSTKMMGLGARAAFLEFLFGFHNWMRTVSYRNVFTRRLAWDLKQAREHKEAFDAFSKLLEEESPDLIAKWKSWVEEWEAEQHTDGIGSPYEMTHAGSTMQDVRLRLGKEELTRTGANIEIEKEQTPSTFITLGLDIEQSQRILTIDMKALSDPSTLQQLDFVKRKTALLKRIKRFRKLQRTYMPDVVTFLTPGQREVFEDDSREPEVQKLCLPSEVPEGNRVQACERGLPAIEEEMREGELTESLEDLRQSLRLRTMTNRFRILRQISIRIHKAKLRYRYARNAMVRLRGHGGWEKEFKVLQDEDVRGINERTVGEEEQAARERLRELGAIVDGGLMAAGVVAAGESKHQMSSIWYTTKLKENGEKDLVQALRVEWCKAYSLSKRWHEDIVLVDEEMRRTIEYGAWSACEWEIRATARTVRMSPELAEGLQAYAMEHVERERETCMRLSGKWAPLRHRAAEYLAGVVEEGREELVIELEGDDVDSDSDIEGDEGVDGAGEEEIDTDDES